MQKEQSVFEKRIDEQKVAIFDGQGVSYTYAELADESKRLLSVIAPRSLVLVLCRRDIETVAFYYCMLRNHIVPIMLAPDFSEEMLAKIIDAYRPAYLWTDNERATGGAVLYQDNIHRLMKTGYESPALHPYLALLLSTSGSTGSRKMVRISYDDIRENAGANAAYFGFCRDDVGMTSLPIHYCYGLSVLHYHWYAGGSVLVTDKSMIDGVYWQDLKKYKITTLQIVPYNFEIMRRMTFKENDLSLRAVIFAGMKMDEEDRRSAYDYLHALAIDCCVAYGQTETVSMISGLANEEILQRKGSVGKPFWGTQTRTDPSDRELIIGGQSICMGYACGRDELQRGEDNMGGLYTGDCAALDEDGYIYLKGRKKRFLKIMGARYSLDEIEMLLQKEFQTKNILCGGVDDTLKIFVAEKFDREDIIRYCSDRISVNERMIEVVDINEVPRNSSGKVLYAELV